MLDTLADDSLRLSELTDPPGALSVPGFSRTLVCVHIGAPVTVACTRGGIRHRGVALHGAIDIIPPQTPSDWQLDGADRAFIVSLSPQLMESVARQMDLDPERAAIVNRFQRRDPALESLAWALKAEREGGFPGGRLYRDSLAVAVASRLLTAHSDASPRVADVRPLSGRRFQRVRAYIDENLSEDLTLDTLAAVAGLSLSHFKSAFRAETGLPVHRYVVQCRVERAQKLLSESRLPISQIALEVGFAHQSHLARHLRRALGVSPRALRGN